MLLLTESTLLFVNLLVTDDEPTDRTSIGGTIKGWAAVVHEKTTPQSMSVTEASDMRTLVSTFNSQPNRATTGGSTTQTTSTQYSATDASITTKFGGFDLDCNEDDKAEE